MRHRHPDGFLESLMAAPDRFAGDEEADMKSALRRYTFILVALTSALTSDGFAQRLGSDGDVTSRAEAYLNSLVSLDRFSGSVLVARGGTILLSQRYGMANLEYDQPNTPQTKFRI